MEKNEFRSRIRDVLNHISDLAYLENNNLVSMFLSEEEARLPNRLQLLRTKVSESIDILKPPENTPAQATEWRCYRILSLRYLRGLEMHRIEEELGLSQRQVHRDMKKGLDALTSILWDHQGISFSAGEGETESATLSDSQNLDIIQNELKSWEISFDLFNLGQMIEQALQLCESLATAGLKRRVDYGRVDHTLNVRLDPVLTKQGLYKLLSFLTSAAPEATVTMHTRKINERFIELSLQFDHCDTPELSSWEVALLFFTIQGVNHTCQQPAPGRIAVTLNLPLSQQNCCLVIDDVTAARRLIERILGSYGIQVFGSDEPEEALKLAQLMKPDFILLDILMPKMDGWQMIKQLKSNPDTRSIPVFICSVLFEPELSQAVGAAAYIRKPIDRLELIETLRQAGYIEEPVTEGE